MDALKIISEGSIKAEKPQFNVGDTVRVDVRIKEMCIRDRRASLEKILPVRAIPHPQPADRG